VDHATIALPVIMNSSQNIVWVNISWLVISIIESWLKFIVYLATAFHLLEYHRMHSSNKYYIKSGVTKHIPLSMASLNICFLMLDHAIMWSCQAKTGTLKHVIPQ